MKRKLCELFIIFICYFFHVSLSRILAIAGISPNWLIILPVFFGFFAGSNEGMFVGFFSGIMYDLFYSDLFGFSALVFIYCGYFAGLLYQKYNTNEILIPFALVMISVFVFEFLCFIGNFLLHNQLNLSYFMSVFIIPETVYTGIVSLIIYKPILWINDLLESVKDRKKGVIDEGSI